jgi:4-oxalocrotonate tautomerase
LIRPTGSPAHSVQTGKFGSEWVATLLRNGWQVWLGISGKFASESVESLARNTQLINGVTQLLVDVLGKNPATTVVVIDEVETDNWGLGGETITARRLSGR